MLFFDDITLAKLEQIYNEYLHICQLLTYEEIVTDSKLCLKYQKDLAKLEPLAKKYEHLLDLEKQLKSISEKNDFESKQEELLYKQEEQTLSDNICNLKNELLLLLDNLYADEQNAIIEIVLGDGENAEDLKNDIVLGYKNYFEKHNFKYEIFDSEQNTLFEVTGLNVKNIMQKEIGFHIAKHGNKNSSCKVFVYDNLNLDKPTFDEQDLKIQTTRSSGAGGQHINTTDSSIKITHIKTGITSVCQDERSQFQNKQKALQNLKEKVIDYYNKQKTKNAEKQKREQVKLIKQNYVAKIYDYQSKTICSKINGKQLSIDDFLSGNDL